MGMDLLESFCPKVILAQRPKNHPGTPGMSCPDRGHLLFSAPELQRVFPWSAVIARFAGRPIHATTDLGVQFSSRALVAISSLILRRNCVYSCCVRKWASFMPLSIRII